MSDTDHTCCSPPCTDAVARRSIAGSLRLLVRHRPKQSLCHTTVTVEIDGVARKGKWGRQEFDVLPGEHRLAVSFRYCRGQRGRAERVIVVTPGDTVQLEYETPAFMFGMRGRLHAVKDRH